MTSLLLVDEDRNFREALAIGLRLDGCAVAAAASASAARSAVQAGRFDLCVVDLHLADAEALLAETLAGPSHLVITGPHADLLAHAAGRYPGATVLAKPFGPGELLARLLRPGQVPSGLP
jgi:DNA-binding response OmpR family regulator